MVAVIENNPASEEEVSIESLSIEMQPLWNQSYMPKIEDYADDAERLNYTVSQVNCATFDGKDVILKSKAEYDAYLDELLQTVEYDYQKEMIAEARDLYSESFFRKNALIITKAVAPSSTNVTVANLYVSEGTIYVVMRTDVDTWCTADIRCRIFGIAVAKSDVVNVDKVVTLE